MTEQQYRVIADRDKGDDPTKSMAQEGDLLIFRMGKKGELSILVRIERTVLTTDEPQSELSDVQYREADEAWMWYADEAEFHVHDVVQEQFIDGYLAALKAHPSSHPPTREQIAEAIYTVRAGSDQNWHKAAFRDDYLKEADAVLALLQKGADRG